MTNRRHAALLGAAAVLALGGCASTPTDADWTDPQFAGTSLRGSKVLLSCEAGEFALKQQCEDRVSAELTAAGAVPSIANGPLDPAAYAATARDAGATAAFIVRVDVTRRDSTSPFSVGLGMFGFGGGHVGGGVGVSVPLGGGVRPEQDFTASSKLVQASSGRLMWTGRALSPPSRDPVVQVDALAKAVVQGAQRAGFF